LRLIDFTVRSRASWISSPYSEPPLPPASNPIPADLQEHLTSVTSKVQSVEQTFEPISQNLARNGETLNAGTLARLSQIRANLDKANRDPEAGNDAAAQDSLSIADALADKLLRSAGR
jgi:hypothetical protein